MKSDDAIRDAYVSVHPALFRFLRKKLGCASEAADLTQESFVRWLDAARHSGRIREPRAFLFRVARNLMQDFWRKESRHAAALHETSGVPSESAPSPEREFDSKQRIVLLAQAVEELPPKCREAFKLHKFAGLPMTKSRRAWASRATWSKNT
jgi:RNA polymerase sigma factor (sigma-70 family)